MEIELEVVVDEGLTPRISLDFVYSLADNPGQG